MANVSLNARVEHAHNASAAEVQRVDVLFHDIEERVVELCEQASQPLLVCAAWARAPRVLRALPAGSRLVCTNDVRLPTYDGLTARKVGLARGSRRPLMHNKFIVRPGRWVATGSYNLTAHSRLNCENVVVLHDARLAALYADEFEAIWAVARPL